MKIQILVDNPNSWIVRYANELYEQLASIGHDASILTRHDQIEAGDILVLLGCEKILKQLSLNKHNLVVHESDLPAGKGWSPMSWQILEGKNHIPITLFEADNKVDAGLYYYKEIIELSGAEFIDEIRALQGIKSIELVIRFVKNFPNIRPITQYGEETFYKKRRPEHSQLSLDRSLREQINLLRIVDNDRYPAFFVWHGRKVIINVLPED